MLMSQSYCTEKIEICSFQGMIKQYTSFFSLLTFKLSNFNQKVILVPALEIQYRALLHA